ncbi:phage protein NinX family protein [Rosenbergiella nectarea]|uniref:phage protein NinX family protein n=1 Tax=Rosenbergiella nectarea TaxID=988801 RepID=UPI003BA9FA9E
MNYQEMSDRHINCLVHDVFICEEQSSFGLTLNVVRHPKDYCNSWADAGPIAEDNEIGVVKVLNGWCATNDHAIHEGVFFVDPNPRRAICIVFLMMKGGE